MEKVRKIKVQLKVFERIQSGAYYAPRILLQGKWLEKCGFEIGDQVLVTEDQGHLTLTVVKQPVEQIVPRKLKRYNPVWELIYNAIQQGQEAPDKDTQGGKKS